MAEQIGVLNISRAKLCYTAKINYNSFQYITGGSFKKFINELSQKYKFDYSSPSHVGSCVSRDMRKNHLLTVGLYLSIQFGYNCITAEQLAKRAGVTRGTVYTYFGTTIKLRNSILSHALSSANIQVITQGIILKDPITKRVPLKLRQKAAKFILNQ